MVDALVGPTTVAPVQVLVLSQPEISTLTLYSRLRSPQSVHYMSGYQSMSNVNRSRVRTTVTYRTVGVARARTLIVGWERTSRDASGACCEHERECMAEAGRVHAQPSICSANVYGATSRAAPSRRARGTLGPQSSAPARDDGARTPRRAACPPPPRVRASIAPRQRPRRSKGTARRAEHTRAARPRVLYGTRPTYHEGK